jgi:His-Xaa-Ser system radical SAM maturase HxsB
MSPETAQRALDLVFASPAPELKIEFQGGEPLLNFDVVRGVIEAAEERARVLDRRVELVITTNLALVDDEILRFCQQHGVFISTSLDGPEDLHNTNRPRPGGDSYSRTINGVARARAALGHDRVAALMTTTRASLARGRDIVDEYVRQGFGSIFLRPLSPFGFAARSVRSNAYTMDEFLAFYFDALDYVISLNQRGVPIVESYAQLLLTKILTPFATGYTDLQSPAGAGIAAVAFNYDGDVYVSDEARMLAEMGDHTFRLGNVHRDDYRAVFGGEVLRHIVESSILESIPGCSDCALQPFCGADPLFHYAMQGDIVGHQPSSTFHQKNSAILLYLLDRYDRDAAARAVFRSWISR